MRRLARPLSALAALVLALGAAEAWLRSEEGTVVFPWDEPGRGFATRPHARGTNAHGFLEREIPPGRDPAARRVVVLGDSMTYGTTTAEQTWTRAAEDALGPPWQVLNFAHYGYDAEACAATLRHHAAAWAPDLVVYASYTNDLLPNTVIELGRFGYPVWIGARGALLPTPLRRASALARAVEGALLARGLEQVPDLELYRSQVADMAAQSRALGAEFLVFGLVPHVFAGGRCEAGLQACLEHKVWLDLQQAAVRGLGLPWIPAEPILDATGREHFYPANPADHEHPGPEGHAALGRGFAEVLRERYAR